MCRAALRIIALLPAVCLTSCYLTTENLIGGEAAVFAAEKVKGVIGARKSAYSFSPTRLTGSSEEVTKIVLANLKIPGVLDEALVFERINAQLPADSAPVP